ncbi:MAG: TlpA disulfide reductase family protein [Desulfobulbaceae bacterium]|nr:TlpA disulfide reductase family protein [Desulfobulbaceae bacterium]
MTRKTGSIYRLFILVLALAAFLQAGCDMGEKEAKRAEVGKPAPVFVLTDIQGNTWNLADLRGKVVFVNFWASWCAPCLEEIPSMVAVNRMIPEEYFQMITVLYNDRPEYALNVVNKAGADFPVLIDLEADAAREYGLTGVPETYIIDPQGILREKFIGPRDWQSMESIAMLEHYFPQSYKKIVE